MINGFVGFQLYEDGTTLSVSLVRGASAAMFAIAFLISILTFKNIGGLGPQNTIGLFVVVYIIGAIAIAVYVVLQILLIIGTLQERWPLWHIGFGVVGFVLGQVILYALSEPICDGVQHYMDGLFFATILNLLAVMMVYKVGLQSGISHLVGTIADILSFAVLGFYHQGGSRILRWPKDEQLGGQGPQDHVRGRPKEHRI
jgi:hypothetical protein